MISKRIYINNIKTNYEIYPNGVVINIKTNKKLKGISDKDKYLHVNLYYKNNGK